jgi:predicted AlkP superfamily pyrophosphatase or phosphodiesterase
MTTTLPAVTCTAQASFMTGLPPDQTGIVANGWLFRDLYEIWFWRQSNRLVKGEKIWEAGKARNPQFTCANMFWWYNMASDHDFGATPRPIYKADGRKLPDCFTVPTDWREKLSSRLGKFPLFNFWGPNTNIASTRWIAKASELAITDFDPTLTLVYLPHLDYDLQRFGPDESHPAVAKSLQEVDQVVGDLIDLRKSMAAKSWSCPNTASRRLTARFTSTATSAAKAGCKCGWKTAMKCSTRPPQPCLPWPITRSRTSTSATPH